MLMVIKANPKLPAITAQNVGRELYYGRQTVVQIIGDKETLENIAWILEDALDMLDLQFQHCSLIVRRRAEVKEAKMDITFPTSEAVSRTQ
jgi:hypothetical protein